MSCGELCLLSELSNIDFAVIVVGRVAKKAQTWILDSNRLKSPFYTPMLSSPTTPISTTCTIIILLKKKLPKTGHILCQKLIHPHNDS